MSAPKTDGGSAGWKTARHDGVVMFGIRRNGETHDRRKDVVMNAYEQDVQQVLQAMDSRTEGLSPQAAEERLQATGKNRLEETGRKSWGKRILEQIKDPMILVLISAAIVSGVFGEIVDMIVILVVVVLNAILGIVQESKAEKAIEALQKMSAPQSRVRRSGTVQRIQTEDLVPGDIVLLEAGDAVPADMRLLETASLKIEEAALTGESVPVDKQTETLEAATGEVPLGDRINMAYMGTNVAYGRGEGVVVATGMKTEMGKIATILSNTEEEKTPLQIKLAGLSKILSVVVIGISVFIFLFGVIRNGGFAGGHVFELLLTAVSLAVAAIPEGLVVVVTVLLSLGVTRMSHRHAIIRRLTAVETLGCAQVICSDKTGTLTQNRMTVVDHFGPETLLAAAMAHCNDVQAGSDGAWVGDPTEIALVDHAQRMGVLDNRKARVAEAPFDSVRKMMSTLHAEADGGVIQYTKGAPDEVLARCDRILIDGQEQPMTDAHREQVLAENTRMANKALRVLAAAHRKHGALPQDASPENLEQSLVFLGLVGMIDPVRPEVVAAIRQCKEAGVRAVMITGDHKDTAIAIAKELGIVQRADQAITGAELSALSDEEFDARLENLAVYARVQPEHKVRIVNAWKRRGKVTAMTGDGVNDAPALKSADIGVGMGITGTDVTKNVADMVLTDDNFASIVYAVEEGRRIYENIRKAIQFLLASNLSEVISIFLATLGGFTLFAPIHILWINLVTDTFPAMALGMEKAEPDVMQKPPRDSKETLFSGGLGTAIFVQGTVIALLTLAAFFIGVAKSQATGMTMAFLTLSLCEIFHSFNLRSRDKSLFALKGHNRYLFGAAILAFVLTLSVIYVPGLNGAFKLTALSGGHLLIGLGLSISVIPIVETYKAIRRKR